MYSSFPSRTPITQPSVLSTSMPLAVPVPLLSISTTTCRSPTGSIDRTSIVNSDQASSQSWNQPRNCSMPR